MSLDKAEAIKAIDPDAMFVIREDQIEWHTPPISDEVIAAKQAELKAEYDSQEYSRNRKEEYPTTEELVVALWEAVIEERMASSINLQGKRTAIKEKYPK